MLPTLYSAGLRRSELCRLKVSNIDSGRMVIRIKRGIGVLVVLMICIPRKSVIATTRAVEQPSGWFDIYAAVALRSPSCNCLMGSQLAIPEWMLQPEACAELKLEAKAHISVGALLEVRKLIGAQSSAVADNSHVRAERNRRSECTARRIRSHGSASFISKTTSFGRCRLKRCRNGVEWSGKSYRRALSTRMNGGNMSEKIRGEHLQWSVHLRPPIDIVSGLQSPGG
jgi:hypothetical protein